jgi:hypothetical protein
MFLCGIESQQTSLLAASAEHKSELDRVFARHQLWWSPHYKFQ